MLHNKYVRTVILSRVLLQLGVWIRNFAILLYVTDLTHNNPQYVSLISVAEFAPIFIFAIIGGTFADRWRPKLTMVWCDILSALSVFAVLAVLMSGSWYALLFGTFISAVLSQFSQPSAMKLFKQHVPGEQLQGVMAMFQSLMAVFMVIGPIMGTFVFQHYGIGYSLVVTGIMFAGSSIVLSFLPRDAVEPADEGSRNFSKELMDGLRYVGASRPLRTLAVAFAASGLGAGLIQPLAIFIVIEKLGQGKPFLQWLLMTNGLAMLIGGAFLIGIAKKMRPYTLLAAGLLVSAVCTIAVGWSTNIGLTLLLQVLSGFFYPWVHTGIQTLILKNTEAAYIGRVGGAVMPVFMGMMVIGMSLAGYLKDALSLFTVYAISGALLIIGALLLVPLYWKRRAAESAAN
ncbi:MFS transporter [Paenibacillus piri]|uniref:MFS transporter n=1 Tax=Paenibacillus piri TaxID=2547395 RepID=A0A4R5KKV8_9BACL|nr:MFS transporter [Paenibacillus piri]TDF95060.1 MFS transporter [Paenibacillus piri]